MGQFFDSNPGDRSPQGPKRGPWRRDLPRDWRTALGLPGADDEAPEGAGADPAAPDATPAVPAGSEVAGRAA